MELYSASYLTFKPEKFVATLQGLCHQLYRDKVMLEQENKKMSTILKQHNLYHKLLEE